MAANLKSKLIGSISKLIDRHAPVLGKHYRERRDRRRKQNAPLTPFGFRLAGPSVMASPDWQAETTSSILSLLDEADIFVDIGANVGFYTCLAASKGKHVISFEPHPDNVQLLLHNIKSNDLEGRVEVFPVGASNASSVLSLFGRSDIASFVEGWMGQEGEPIYAPSITLDSAVAGRFSGKKLLIKVDVEGFEPEVVGGALETMRMSPPPVWIMELFHADPYSGKDRSTHFDAVMGAFTSAGYTGQSLGQKHDAGGDYVFRRSHARKAQMEAACIESS